jgi:S1-C subfamily serine protease
VVDLADFRRTCSLAAGVAVGLLPGLASALPIADSQSQVGAWRIGAYTRGTTTSFDHCSLSRLQGDGFGLAIGVTSQGIWTLALEAPDWGLTAKEAYTTSLVVGSTNAYRFTGRALNDRVMVLDVAPEIFAQMKSGVQFQATANQHRYAMSLDGIEAASDRARTCVRQYGGQPSSPPSSQASQTAAPSTALVTSIQVLLSRLGYDPGPLTGVVGLKTNMAISAFQKSQGESGDGLPSEAVRAKLERVVAERTGSAQPAARAEGQRPEAPRIAPPRTEALLDERPRKPAAVSTGTGFHISPDTLITNFHVINGCAELHIRKNGAEQGRARVVAASPSDDLAALKADAPTPTYLKLRGGSPIKPAEDVLVFGYPLSGALSSSGNTTLGNVTALTGLRDDSRYIQISAAVQPGNSGGPALDGSGRVMGVIVSKLNALAFANITGDIPQNVNFAIKVSTLTGFLEAHKISYESDSAAHELSNTQRAERAEASSAQLECWK